MNIKIDYSTNSDTKHSLFNESSLKEKLNSFNKIIDDPKNGFFHLLDNENMISQTKKLHQKYAKIKHFVQIGIGGSALGPKMLVSALRKNWDISFSLLDNIDSDYLYDELAKIDPLKSLFYIVSKSGGTAETIACYSIVRNLLIEKGVTEENLNKYFVFCTDPESGQLREHVTKHNYDALEVPSNVGGRFSVLTPVGLLPAIFMGINIDELYTGANKIKSQLLSEDVNKNDLLKTATHLAFLFSEATPKVDETVLMPYSSKLKDLSSWFVQLWAESLGKFSTESNSHTGLTPVPAYGATDQHSQMQLFMEGTNNKCLLLLKIDQMDRDFSLKSDLDLNSAEKLKPYSMNQLMEAEFQGTLSALKDNNRNVISITMDKLSEENIGGLILFFESLTALMGEYLLVDPFNQPGVEKGKKFAFDYLNSLRK